MGNTLLRNWAQALGFGSFEATDNAGYSKELAEHQKPKAHEALAYLVRNGKITNADVFYKFHLTDGRKLFTDWRKAGYLRAARDPAGHDDVPNADGKGKHRVHYYTGKPIMQRGEKVDVSC